MQPTTNNRPPLRLRFYESAKALCMGGAAFTGLGVPMFTETKVALVAVAVCLVLLLLAGMLDLALHGLTELKP